MSDLLDILSGSPTEQPAVTSSTTPAGYTIHYCADPRSYRIGGESWETATDVPSVTTVLDVLHKGGLVNWGQRVGIQGAIEFFMQPAAGPLDEPSITAWMKEKKLTVNHVRDKAATRGTNVHDALEQWALTGKMASPDDFPTEEQGYVRGLNAFLADCKGMLVAGHAELMVGSKQQGFAGRFDLLAATPQGMEFQTGPRTKRVIPAGTGIFDLKTSKSVYDSHYLQLSAYRLALEESGYGRSDFEAIILVNADGKYDVKLNPKRPEHFLAVLNTWRVLKG